MGILPHGGWGRNLTPLRQVGLSLVLGTAAFVGADASIARAEDAPAGAIEQWIGNQKQSPASPRLSSQRSRVYEPASGSETARPVAVPQPEEGRADASPVVDFGRWVMTGVIAQLRKSTRMSEETPDSQVAVGKEFALTVEQVQTFPTVIEPQVFETRIGPDQPQEAPAAERSQAFTPSTGSVSSFRLPFIPPLPAILCGVLGLIAVGFWWCLRRKPRTFQFQSEPLSELVATRCQVTGTPRANRLEHHVPPCPAITIKREHAGI
jgi:hypothetical protein